MLEQHAGTIRIIKDDEVMEEPFLVLPELDATGGHKGVLGLAFHPQYATNGYFYVHYTKQPTGRIVIERFQVTDDPDVADPLSAQMVIDSVTHTSGHRGGWIDFTGARIRMVRPTSMAAELLTSTTC